MDLDLLDLYGRASEWTSTKVAGASSKLQAPTSCDGWDVGMLMSHMLQTQHYFVAAARGEDAAPPIGDSTGPAQRRAERRLRARACRDVADVRRARSD